jgi:hypothetical protein
MRLRRRGTDGFVYSALEEDRFEPLASGIEELGRRVPFARLSTRVILLVGPEVSMPERKYIGGRSKNASRTNARGAAADRSQNAAALPAGSHPQSEPDNGT